MSTEKKEDWELEDENIVQKLEDSDFLPPPVLKLNKKDKPQRKTRTVRANEMQEEKWREALISPSLPARLGAFLIDAIFCQCLVFLSKSPPTFFLQKLYLKYLNSQGMEQTLEPKMLENIFVGGVYLLLYMALYLFPAAHFRRTWGKQICGLWIGNAQGEVASWGTVFWRELLFRPLSVLTIIGPCLALMLPWQRTLHDILTRTVVYKK